MSIYRLIFTTAHLERQLIVPNLAYILNMLPKASPIEDFIV